jgi:iron complex outermembrane receptor protein
MINRILVAVAVSMSFTSMAQHKVEGVVLGNGVGLDGATVTLFGASTQRVGTQNGAFALQNLPAGNYRLRASHTGFVTLDTNVGVPCQRLTLELRPDTNLLQHVEIKAIRAGETSPFAKTNIGKTAIEKANLGADIPFLLNEIPGVVVNSDAGNGVGYTALRLRGSDASRINVTLNGVPYNDAESQGTFFVNMPDLLSSINSIQVQRGVGTSSNGPGAFGGGISLSTGEYKSSPYGNVNLGFGSFGTYKQTLKYGSGLIGKQFTIDARLSRVTSEGYIDRASSNLLGAYLNMAWWGKNSSLRFVFLPGKETTYQAWYGIPESDLQTNRTGNSAGTEKPGDPYPNETDNYQQRHYQLIYTKKLRAQTVFNSTLYLSTGKGYYQQYKAAQPLGDYGLPPITIGGNSITETDLVRQLWLRNKLFGQTISLQKKYRSAALTIGGNWSIYPGRHFGEIIWTEANPALNHVWYNLNARKTDISTYVKYEQPLSALWQLFADVQYRYVQYRIDGFRYNPGLRLNNVYHFVNPKLGISFKKEHLSGFLSYAVGNKEPNRDDFETGANQQPQREQLHDIELNVQHKQLLKGLEAGITLYSMRYADQLVLTGQINDVGAYSRTNTPRSYRLGAELETKYRHKKLALQYNFSLSKNRIDQFTEFVDDYDNGGQLAFEYRNTPISFSPAVVQYLSIGYQPITNFTIEAIGKHVSRQYLDNTGNTSRSLSPFLTTDFRLSYQITAFKLLRQLQLVLQVNNVFGALYEPNGYTFSYFTGGQTVTENFYYPMAGRHFMAAINLAF